ncbi:MAG TPA: hypothetical protein VF033_12560, partial [Steroidobacteraceae bacterium]
MKRALVFGEPALAQFVLLSLDRALRAELCADAADFAGAPMVVLADRGWRTPEDRAAALAAVAEASVRGTPAFVLRSEAEAARWVGTARGFPAARQMHRIAILGEPGVGKTVLASALAPALSLPHVSLDHELWWREGRPARFRDRAKAVRALADDDAWVAEGVYLWLAIPFARRASLTIHLDLPASVARRQRHGRVPATDQPAHARLLTASMRAAYPSVTARLARRELSRIAHLGPVLHIRTEGERDAVT